MLSFYFKNYHPFGEFSEIIEKHKSTKREFSCSLVVIIKPVWGDSKK